MRTIDISVSCDQRDYVVLSNDDALKGLKTLKAQFFVYKFLF